MFDIIDEMPDDADEAVVYIIEFIEEGYEGFFARSSVRNINPQSRPDLLSLLHMLKNAQYKSSFPDTIGRTADLIIEEMEPANFTLNEFIKLFALIKSSAMASKVDRKLELNSVSTFVLPTDDIDKIFSLTSEMRNYVSTQSNFDDNHKNRILKRISAIEFEVRKPKGLKDTILAGFKDFGLALGEFGEDVRPLVETLEEVYKIVDANSNDAKKLPAPEEQRKLPAPKNEEE